MLLKIWTWFIAAFWIFSSVSSFAGGLPIAQSYSYGAAESSVFTADAPGVLSNDYDNNGDTLLVVEVQANAVNVSSQINLASGATLILGEYGSVTHDPTESETIAALTGSESFDDQFTHLPGDDVDADALPSVTITITVALADREPWALDDSFTIS